MRVDATVCLTKFDQEVEKVRGQADFLQSRGCFLLGAPTFPAADFLFVPKHPLKVSVPAPQGRSGYIIQPPPGTQVQLMAQALVGNLAARAFKVRVDLSDFDMRAPSVAFLDPWTSEPIPYGMLLRAWNYDPQSGPHLVLLDNHPATKRPFLCLRGIREYHEHPQHTGDDWMLYRAGSGLFSVLMEVIRACIDLTRPNLVLQSGGGMMVNWEPEVAP